MKSRKLQKAIAAAEASMWVGINSIQLSENDCALSIALICSIVSTELSRNCKWHVVMANIYYSYPQMQWLFDVKICIVEIHTSVIILWFFYLYFMKGTKLHWNICCYKRENVDVIWIRLDTTMQCRGINRKDCSQVTDFGKFGLKACFGGWGLWKNPNLRSRLWKPNFSKSINSEQFLRWIPQHCAQSWSDNIYIYPLIARLQVSRVWREKELVCRVLKKLKVCWVFDFTGGFGLKVLSCWFWLRTGVLYSEFILNSWKQIKQ